MAGSKDDDDLDSVLNEIQDKVVAFTINKNGDLSDQNCSSKWTAEQRENMKVCHKYGLDVIDFVQKCWSQGPTKEKFPESPVISFVDSLRKTNEKDKVSVTFVKKQTKKTKRVVSVNNMSATEFDLYLKSKLFEQNDNFSGKFSKMNSTNDMKEVVILLKENVRYFNSVDASSLIKHIEFGRYLIVAKDLFRKEKKNFKLKQSWEKWIVEKIQISPSYVRLHKEVATLCDSYQRLRYLAMTYTELCRLKHKIREVFSTNETIADYWRVHTHERTDIESN